MHQPWRSFAAIINKCLSGKTTTLESLRLSRAQILWGMYHNKKVDYVYLLWEDLVFQVENKNSKKNNDILQNQKPQSRKLILKHLPRRRLLKLLKEKRIKSSAKGDKAAKKKQPTETSMDKGLTVLSDVALTEVEQLKLVIERSKTQTHSSQASGSGTDEGIGVKPGVPDVPSYNSNDEQISWKSSDEEDDDEVSLNDDDDDVSNQDDDDDQKHDDANDDA
ncbi:hypothetical protein Tco_0470699 [Tanacetum coccineum]